MRCFVVLSLVALCTANPLFSPVPIQYHAQDGLGQYTYGYDGGPSAKQETRTWDGVTRGGYSYLDSHGIVQSAAYVSDPANGFRVAATNLPVGPAVPDHGMGAVLLHRARRSPVWPYTGIWNYGGAPLHPDGTVADTPEVVAAKVAHFSAKAHATGHLPLVYSPHFWNYGGAPLHLDGTVADTPEVAAAKVAHFVAKAHAVSRGKRSVVWPYSSIWHYGGAPLHPDGTVADTPEVAAAKVAHFSAKARVAGHLPFAYGPHIWNYGGAPLHPDGTVADTPEVAITKAAHFAAHHEALSRGKRSAPLHPDGTVADTPEVVAAKVAHFNSHAVTRGYPFAYPYAGYPYGGYGYGGLYNPLLTGETPAVAAAKVAHFAAHHEAHLRNALHY